jgi:Flp pilus assembly pilin Flp
MTKIVKASLVRDERGRDIVVYALPISMLALRATAGMSPVASAIAAALSKIASTLGAYTR